MVDLKKQLRDKDMKLTDIRLEALSSAHQLEQLRETMNKMKVKFTWETMNKMKVKFNISHWTKWNEVHELVFYIYFNSYI